MQYTLLTVTCCKVTLIVSFMKHFNVEKDVQLKVPMMAMGRSVNSNSSNDI